MRIHRVYLLATTAVLVACGGYGSTGSNSTASGTPVNLETQDNKFIPASLALKPGDSVTLTIKNSGQKEHNFSIDGTSISQDVEAGATKTITFTVPGSGGAFHCKYHQSGGMVGTLGTTKGGGAAPTTGAGSYSSY
jgi:plastocyanin